MAKNSSRATSPVSRRTSELLILGDLPPILDEIDDDPEESWASWRDSTHGLEDWESGTEEMRLSLE